MSTGPGTGERHSLVYDAVRAFIKASVRIYFGRIEVTGRDRIPFSGPVVVVSNHPNSVVDAFLLGTQLTRRRINFIAKDSIPGLPIVGALLRKCGVIGVARRIDYPGEIKQTLGRNLKAIDTCTPHLERGEIVTIFGEGVSTDSRKLGIIKKGAVRIGYNAEQLNDFRLGVTFVPVGINYSDKVKFRSSVLIEVGVPFRLTDVAANPRENMPRVLHEGTRKLQESIERAIVNLEHEELGPLLDRTAGILLARGAIGDARQEPLDGHFEAKRRLAEWIDYMNQTEPKFLEHLRAQLDEYSTVLRRMHIDDVSVAGRARPGGLLRDLWKVCLGFPALLVSFYGWVNNLLPRYLGRFARQFGRQREIRTAAGGSPRIVVARETLAAHYGGWAGALIGYPLQVFLLGWIISSASTRLAGIVAGGVYALTLVPSWQFSLMHAERVRNEIAGIRLGVTILMHRLTLGRIRRRRTALIQMIRRSLADYDALQPARE